MPPGVAPKDPPPLTEEDRRVKRKLEQLGGGASPEAGEARGRAETDGPERKGA
ncbi:hypothetical protein [Muricoccus nepalensis]|uniref:hypothetical protein n=1 Tax=Muricoccus nepalensis TaxID=1854500 RepID=UPI001386ACEB|nr:hypothetical protein [Roseomonas nepalensis]